VSDEKGVALMGTADIDDGLASMELWCAQNPPLEGWFPHRQAEPKIVHLHPHCRMTIQVEIAADLAYGLDRNEHLAEMGVSSAELDSKAFAKSLLGAIQDHLSIANLRDLKEVFSNALDVEEAHRVHLVDKIDGKS